VLAFVSAKPRRYKNLSVTGSASLVSGSESFVSVFSGGLFFDADGVMRCDMKSSTSATSGYFWPDHEGPGGSRVYDVCASHPYEYLTWGLDYQEVFYALYPALGELLLGSWGLSSNGTLVSSDATHKAWNITGFYDGSLLAQLSNEYRTDDLLTDLDAALTAASYSAYNTSFPTAAFDIATNESSALAEESKYKIQHRVPKVGNGKCYRVEWVERFVPKVTFDAEAPYHANGGGASITSVEILNRGVFRPDITIGAVVTGYDEETGEPIVEGTDGGGFGLKLVAVMSSGGSVASIRILHPGNGYTEAPTITLEGDAEAVAVVDLDEGSPNKGRIIAVNVTSGGDYLPELVFNSPELGGTQAVATCTLDPQGGIATVSVTNAGQYYSTVSLGIDAEVMSTAPSLFVHWGQETPKCYNWDGVKPSGYADSTPSTYPTSAEYDFPKPVAEGDRSMQIKRVLCDCSTCP
jgi:hypothetical protein